MTRTASPPLIEEEPGPKQTNQVGSHGEVTLLDEEVTNPDQEPEEEEIQVAETTPIEMANSATSARFKGTDKRSARKGSRRTNHAETRKDGPTGLGSISWMRTQTRRLSTPSITRMSDTRVKKAHSTLPEFSINQEPQPFPSNFWVFSKELDDSPHPSS
jgi:hypothetical protein